MQNFKGIELVIGDEKQMKQKKKNGQVPGF